MSDKLQFVVALGQAKAYSDIKLIQY